MQSTAVPKPVRRRSIPWKLWLAGYLFVLPAVIFNLIFEYIPMSSGIYHSFFRWDGGNMKRFVGFDNYIRIFQDPVFWTSVQNMAFFLVFNILLMLPTIVAAIILFRIKNSKAQFVYRVIFCLPLIIPGIVTMLLWQFMYNPQFGFFNQALKALGMEAHTQLWLADPALAKWSLLFMGFPWIITVPLLIYLGGLQSIDGSVWDACKMDGIGSLRRLISVELPLIAGQFRLNLISVLSVNITGYGLQLIMTNGGPGFATLVPGLYMYQRAFGGELTDFGYASAVGMILFVVAFLLSILSIKMIRNEG